MNIFDFTFLLL